MKSLNQWLEEYSEGHTHPTNILIHRFCVPLIEFSLLGFLWSLPTPPIFLQNPFINWATLFLSASFVFYVRLSVPLTIGLLLQSFLMVSFFSVWNKMGLAPLWQVSVPLFTVAWIFQFIGHKIEGKKPSFFKDLQFLLIGPLWTLTPFYHFLGIKY